MAKYDTNLASEYYVLSMLYRKGLNAYLTLGNKKSVDIIVENKNGSILTIDVKGLAGKICWAMDNFKTVKDNHFIILVAFLDKMKDHGAIPECWIIPSPKIKPLLYTNPKGNRTSIDRHTIRKIGMDFKDNWKSLTDTN